MKKRWRVWLEKIDAMQPRERLLVLFATITVFYVVWDLTLLRPLLADKKQISVNIDNLRQQLGSLQQERQVLLQSLNSDPDAGQKREIATLKTQQKALSKELSTLSVGLVPVAELPQILRDLLQRRDGLTLLGMETLPVQELRLSDSFQYQPDSLEETRDKALSTGVFKHTVVVLLKGEYFDVQDYLAALENLPWRFYWEQMNYTVESYPEGTVELRVYTLSSEVGLLGV
ncbi:MAG: hypothetical protein P8Y42_14085 [Exilibacterium sp.]